MTGPGADLLVRAQPFRHAIFTSWLNPRFADHLVGELEQFAWERDRTPLHRFSVPADAGTRRVWLPAVHAEALSDPRRRQLEDVFECDLGGTAILELHRYAAGDGIAPHTDCQLPEVRLVFNLNRHWHMAEGGVWVLAANAALKQDTVYLPATHNTGFAFSTGVDTFHALSRYEGVGMYGLVLRIPR